MRASIGFSPSVALWMVAISSARGSAFTSGTIYSRPPDGDQLRSAGEARTGLPAHSDLNQLLHAIQHLCGTLDVDMFVLDQDWKSVHQPRKGRDAVFRQHTLG